jgi:NAD(P)-dependent dehydrogenase (short-subunit alcohol dehydrogenase family)
MFDYSPRPGLLDGRVILITGANRGIGEAAARGFAAHGATVILCGRDRDGLEALYDSIVAAGDPEPAIQLLDLEADMDATLSDVAAALDAEFGRLDGLLHNAGLLGPITPIALYPAAEWRRVMHVNVTAAFLLTQALLPALQASDDASVVFTSSGVGRRGRAYWGAYATSKFAVEGLSQVLADEVANTTSIRVNAVNPGATRTAMRQAAFPGEDPATLPTAEAILPVYYYLFGPDSHGITGQSFDAQA